MLERLELRDVGPAPAMRIEPAPRLNVLAGDNGAGKTLLLDIAWWALSGTWAGYPAAPHRRDGARPALRWVDRRPTESYAIEASFSFLEQQWQTLYSSRAGSERPTPVVYGRADGGFSVWDPQRTLGQWPLPAYSAFHFSAPQIWDGLPGADGAVRCNGLIRDWATWQAARGLAFETLVRVLDGLSRHPGAPLRPGAATARMSLQDPRDVPTLDMPYGAVPVLLASTGMKRILALAYLLVWTWREHVEAAALKGVPPSPSIVVLLDEVEAHLHPHWQRVLLPALLAAVRELSPALDVQLFATTHAPLVLSSLERRFDDACDALFHLELEGDEVTLSKVPWALRGDVSLWFTPGMLHPDGG